MLFRYPLKWPCRAIFYMCRLLVTKKQKTNMFPGYLVVDHWAVMFQLLFKHAFQEHRPFYFFINSADLVLLYESVAQTANIWNLISGLQKINTWHDLFTYWTTKSVANPITGSNTKSMKLRKNPDQGWSPLVWCW